MKSRIIRLGRSGLALAAVAALTAGCGGGGGSGNSDARVVVPQTTRSVAASSGSDASSENFASLGGWLARAVLSASSDGAFDVTGVRETPTGVRNGAAVAASAVHARIARAALRLGAPAFTGREQAATVSPPQALPCENIGGSGTVTVDDTDNNRKLGAGDSLTISLNNCVLSVGIPAASGTMQLTLNAVELDADDVPTAIDASAVVTSFSVDGYGSYTGSMRLWAKPEGNLERSRVSYRNTNVTLGGGALVFDFDLYGLGDDTSTSFDLNGGIGIGGQIYSIVSTGVMTATGTNPPSTGATQLRDAAGDAVRLSAASAATFSLDFLPAGATMPTASAPGLLWADYLGAP